MPNVTRFGVSLEGDLLKDLDAIVKNGKFANRSQGIRNLIRSHHVSDEWRKGKEVAGTITLVYDHHKKDLVKKTMDIQHDHHKNIISTQHIHLGHHNCLEVLIVKGKPNDIHKLVLALKSAKGVKHTSMSMATTAEMMP